MFFKNKSKEDIKSLNRRLTFLEEYYYNSVISQKVKELEEKYSIQIINGPYENSWRIFYNNLNSLDFTYCFTIYADHSFLTIRDKMLYFYGPFEEKLKVELYDRRIKNDNNKSK
jgi:hypothetical protein